MRTFQGATREWSLCANIGTLQRIRQMTGFDLLHPDADHDGQPLATFLLVDIASMVDVLHAMCLPQATEAGIDAAGFAAELDGPNADGGGYIDARVQFFEELQDFFMRAGHHQLAAILATQVEAITAGQAEILEQAKASNVGQLTVERIRRQNIPSQMAAAMNGLGAESGKSPAGPASTHGR